MTTNASRNLSLSLSIGGVLARSLPASTKRISSELERLREKVSQEREELRGMQTRLKGLDRDTEEYADTLNKVGRSKSVLKELGDEIQDLTVHERDLTDQSNKFAGRLDNIGKAASVAAGLLAGFAAGLVTVRDQYEKYRELQRAQTVGSFATIADAQKVAVQLDATGIRESVGAAEELGKEIQVRLGEALLERRGPSFDALRAIGFTPETFQAIDGVIARIEAVDEALNRTGQQASRTFILEEIFGGQGAEVALQFLNADKSVRDSAMGIAESVHILNEDAVRDLQRMQASTAGLGVEWNNLKQGITAGASPVITVVTDKLAGVVGVIADLAAESPVLAAGIATVGPVLGVLGSSALEYAGDLADVSLALRGTAIATKGMAVAEGVLSTAIATKTVALFASVGGWVAATVAAIGFNVATGGILIAIGAIALGTYLLIKNWDEVKAAVISGGQYLKSVWDSIPGPIKVVIGVMFPVLGVTALIISNFGTLKSVAQSVFSAIASYIEPVVGGIKTIGKFLGIGGGTSTPTDGVETASSTRPSPPGATGGQGGASSQPGSSGYVLPRSGVGPDTAGIAQTNHYTITGVTNPDEVAKKVGQEQQRNVGRLTDARVGG